MNGPQPVLSVRDLSVRFRMRDGAYVQAVGGAHFDLAAGECLALVGESGCGKSVLASALLGLLPGNAETAGSAYIGDLDLLAADERTLARTVRGRRVGLVPQSPAAHLTPVRTVRSQLEETVRELTGVRRGSGLRAAAEEAAERAAFPAGHLDRHPHELSGGLAQRAATALALVGDAPCSSPTNPRPDSTVTSWSAPSTNCAVTSGRSARSSSSRTTSRRPSGSPTAWP